MKAKRIREQSLAYALIYVTSALYIKAYKVQDNLDFCLSWV